MKKNKLFSNIALLVVIGSSMVHIQLLPMKKWFQAAKKSGAEAAKETSEAAMQPVEDTLGKVLEEKAHNEITYLGKQLSNISVAPIEVNTKPIENIVTDIKESLANVMTPENALKLGAGLAIAGAGYYGSRRAWNYLENTMLNRKNETLDNEAYPKYGRMDRLRRWWAGYKTPLLIFNPEVKARLQAIKAKTKNIRDRILSGDTQATYTNLLLYGPPGTGKTTFARALADYTDMDFLPVSAARLLQSELVFNEVIDLANRSSYGAIIFIDEADTLFMDRQLLMASQKPDALAQYSALTHILSITGQKNSKYMIIAATNHPHVLDESMNRRFPDTIEMPLPTLATRTELLNLYINNLLFNTKNSSKQFIAAARALLTPAVIQAIAQKTENFSHSTIENLVTAMRDSVPPSGVMTQGIIDTAITDALIRVKEGVGDKEKRANISK